MNHIPAFRVSSSKTPIFTGSTDYAQLRCESKMLDQTLFIKEVLDSEDKVMAITHMRRAGKSINLSMLKYFFELNLDDKK